MKHNLAKWSRGNLPNQLDPRIAIAEHIGWVRPQTYETDFHIPEPDNFNYALLATKLLVNPDIKDQVFYKTARGWWNVYLVSTDEEPNFLAWTDSVDVISQWRNPRSPRQRQKRGLLNVGKERTELSINERLYTLGYYEKLSAKILTEDDEIITKRLGKLRDNLDNYTSMHHDFDSQD